MLGCYIKTRQHELKEVLRSYRLNTVTDKIIRKFIKNSHWMTLLNLAEKRGIS